MGGREGQLTLAYLFTLLGKGMTKLRREQLLGR